VEKESWRRNTKRTRNRRPEAHKPRIGATLYQKLFSYPLAAERSSAAFALAERFFAVAILRASGGKRPFNACKDVAGQELVVAVHGFQGRPEAAGGQGIFGRSQKFKCAKNCNLTHLWRNEQTVNAFGDVAVLKCYSLRQAQVCMALARASSDPALKQRYEELALDFVQNARSERDVDITSPPVSNIKRKPDGGNSNPLR
jgi:hypothetical protein